MRTAVIIPTWRRSATLQKTLVQVRACKPPVDEILIHVDAGDDETVQMLQDGDWGDRVKWLSSDVTQGPGGGRNRLAEECSADLVVSLDDDSWPMDLDFFERVIAIFVSQPELGLCATAVYGRGDENSETEMSLTPVSSFENCGCCFRRSAFLETDGYVPLRYAYGMEEADVALQLLDKGWEMAHASHLRIFHDTDLGHHVSLGVNAAQISNTALLSFLRYPVIAWPLGLIQVLNRFVYSLRMKRYRGVWRGIFGIPGLCWKHRMRRRSVSLKTLCLSRSRRRALVSSPGLTSGSKG